MARPAAIGALLLGLAAAGSAGSEGAAAELRLAPAALATFAAERQRVPLLRIFDRQQRQVLEVRGWGENLRPLEGLAGREPVPGRPGLAARLAELAGPVPTPDPAADYTVLLYRAHWCAVCKRMEPQLRAQIRAAAPLRFDLVRIEADTVAAAPAAPAPAGEPR
jgi:hypothetical protein